MSLPLQLKLGVIYSLCLISINCLCTEAAKSLFKKERKETTTELNGTLKSLHSIKDVSKE